MRAKGLPDLCCIINPIIAFDGRIQNWCAYCRKQICNDCMNKYSYDDYFHHRRCLKKCAHDIEHEEHDSGSPDPL